MPSKEEIAQCKPWLQAELELLRPELIIPVGKLAIAQFLEVDKLVDVIGQSFKKEIDGRSIDIVPLPHPSGASTWHQRPPGKNLLEQALKIIEQHVEWRALL